LNKNRYLKIQFDLSSLLKRQDYITARNTLLEKRPILDSTAYFFLEKLRTFSCKKRLSTDKGLIWSYIFTPTLIKKLNILLLRLHQRGHASVIGEGVRIKGPCIEAKTFLRKNANFCRKKPYF